MCIDKIIIAIVCRESPDIANFLSQKDARIANKQNGSDSDIDIMADTAWNECCGSQ